MDAALKVMEPIFKALGGIGIAGLASLAVGCVFLYFRQILVQKLVTKLTRTQSVCLIWGAGVALFVLGVLCIGATLTANLAPLAAPIIAERQRATKTVTLILTNSGKQIKEPFTVTYTLGHGFNTDANNAGWQIPIQGVPASADELDVSAVACDGYEVEKEKDAYPIGKSNIVRVPMVKVDKRGAPEDLPDVAKVAAPLVPTEQVVMQREAKQRSEFLLTVKNLTGEKLTLALYNCYAHYHHDGQQPPQLVFSREVEAGKQLQPFPRLVKVSTGLCVPCIIAPDSQVYPFPAQDFYANPAPLLTITKTSDPDKPYALEFGEAPDD